MREQELYDFLQEHYYPDIQKSEGTYDAWDCISEEHKLFIELKSRNTHYNTLLLEKKKYDKLITLAEEKKLTPLYINSTPNGVYSFPLSSMDIQWEDKLLPVTTEFSNNDKIVKTVTFLHITDDNTLCLFE